MKAKKPSKPTPTVTPLNGATTTEWNLVTDRNELPEYFLHRKDLAGRLQISLRTLDRWMQLGLIPSYKVGNSVLFDWDDVCVHLRRNFRLTPGGRHE